MVVAELRKWGGNDASRKKHSQDQAILTSQVTPGAHDSCVTNEALSCKQTEAGGWRSSRVGTGTCTAKQYME